MSEDRIEALEERLMNAELALMTAQEQIEQLDEVVTRCNRENLELRGQLKRLERQLERLLDPAPGDGPAAASPADEAFAALFAQGAAEP